MPKDTTLNIVCSRKPNNNLLDQWINALSSGFMFYNAAVVLLWLYKSLLKVKRVKQYMLTTELYIIND